jgi:capsular polysaccharide transport system ATP-binding protein
MITLREVTKSYRTHRGRNYVLRNVDLHLPEGVNLGILGRNGAGKSTLIRMLGGIEPPDSGEIVTDKAISWPLALLSGFQGSLSGRDNVKFACRIHGARDEELRRRIAFIQEFSELGDYFDMPVKTYSSGMRSRLGFALSMAFEFDVYLVDEITSVGDRSFKQKCTQAFDALRGRSSVVMVSHSMDALRRQCDMGLVLHDGQVQLFDTIQGAIDAYNKGLGRA